MQKAVFDWAPYAESFRAEMPGDVTLCASPDRMKWGKPARGAGWRVSVSHWDARTRTMSRFGRDVWSEIQPTKRDAMRLAERVYLDAIANA